MIFYDPFFLTSTCKDNIYIGNRISDYKTIVWTIYVLRIPNYRIEDGPN